MLTTRAIELINSEIDGELSADDSAELESILASSAEARLMKAELQKLVNVLEGMPKLAPPADLAERILGRADVPGMRRGFSLRSLFASLQPAPVGLAFAAGLLLTVGVYEMSPGQRSADEVSSMVGTIVVGARSGEQSSKDAHFDISGPGVSGTVTLTDAGNLVILGFDLVAEQETEILVDLNAAGLSFGGIAREVSSGMEAGEYYEISGGDLRVVNEASRPFSVYLRRLESNNGSPRGIGIEVNHAGEHVYNGVFGLEGESG